MNTQKPHHIDKNAILMSIVDGNRLSKEDRHHLTDCFQCRTEKEKVAKSLAHLGETAKKMTPVPQKRPVLPAASEKSTFGAGLFWKPALASALAIVIIFTISIWTIGPKKTQTVASNETGIELWEEEQLMLEMNLIAENDLPGEYAETKWEEDVDFEEAFLDYIAPMEDSQPLSFDQKLEGGPLC